MNPNRKKTTCLFSDAPRRRRPKMASSDDGHLAHAYDPKLQKRQDYEGERHKCKSSMLHKKDTWYRQWRPLALGGVVGAFYFQISWHFPAQVAFCIAYILNISGRQLSLFSFFFFFFFSGCIFIPSIIYIGQCYWRSVCIGRRRGVSIYICMLDTVSTYTHMHM